VSHSRTKSEIGLRLHHLFKVELQICLARERGVVAEQTKQKAVRDEAPEPLLRAVQQLLKEAVR
jgi:hypothetical protein